MTDLEKMIEAILRFRFALYYAEINPNTPFEDIMEDFGIIPYELFLQLDTDEMRQLEIKALNIIDN